MDALKGRIEKLFVAKFQAQPSFFYSPGRINLIGEHVDYNNGLTIQAAINKGIVFGIAPNNSDHIKAYSLDMTEEMNCDLKVLKKMNGWKNFLLGVVDQMQKMNLPVKGFDLIFGGTIPIGCGLGSSSALGCGFAFALNSVFQLGLDPNGIIQLCQKAEAFTGSKGNPSEAYTSIMAKKDHGLLIDCHSFECKQLPLKLKDHVILLINSKVQNSHAGGEFNIRKQQCERGLLVIKKHYPEVNTFSDITPEQLQKLESEMDMKVYSRCLYVAKEIQRTKKAVQLLQEDNIQEFARLMGETQDDLNKLYNVSCPEIDFLISQARNFKGIVGSRMMGGGFGGCTINIAEKEKANSIATAITIGYKIKFKLNAEAYIVDIADGTHAI